MTSRVLIHLAKDEFGGRVGDAYCGGDLPETGTLGSHLSHRRLLLVSRLPLLPCPVGRVLFSRPRHGCGVHHGKHLDAKPATSGVNHDGGSLARVLTHVWKDALLYP